MLITKKYGSFVFLGEIITDIKINPDKPIEDNCGECSLCFNSCPTKSINKIEGVPNICLSYITQKKDMEDKWFNKLDGRLFGCDSCQDVCPYNKKVEKSTIEELKSYEHMKNISTKELINIDNKIFKEKYGITSCGWRGKNILQRNILINLVNLKKTITIDRKIIRSPYVIDYYHRLLKTFNL
jgi:epoxyqueuosine reductase